MNWLSLLLNNIKKPARPRLPPLKALSFLHKYFNPPPRY